MTHHSDQPEESPREFYLALGELARRRYGDVPHSVDLTPYELRVTSQNGEDGILAEIIRRSGAPGRFAVEFGAHGSECNALHLLDVLGWSGLLMDGSDTHVEALAHRYAGNANVRVGRALVTPENVEELFAQHGVPAEPDVLSIDVDGMDYWIWEAIRKYRPRIVVIEYNGSLPPGRRLVQQPDTGPWQETDYYGASIEALVALADRRGYALVHTELTGNNAFFVRDDLAGAYLPPHQVPRRRSNNWLAGGRHPRDTRGLSYVEV